jgi:hypothetical protein
MQRRSILPPFDSDGEKNEHIIGRSTVDAGQV